MCVCVCISRATSLGTGSTGWLTSVPNMPSGTLARELKTKMIRKVFNNFRKPYINLIFDNHILCAHTDKKPCMRWVAPRCWAPVLPSDGGEPKGCQ